MKQISANSNDATTGHKLQGNVKRCHCCNIMANRRTGSNVQEVGVCCPILSVHTIRTLPSSERQIPDLAKLFLSADPINLYFIQLFGFTWPFCGTY